MPQNFLDIYYRGNTMKFLTLLTDKDFLITLFNFLTVLLEFLKVLLQLILEIY